MSTETGDGVWRLPSDHPHHLGRRSGKFCFVGGAADLDATGSIRNPEDLLAQVAGAMQGVASTLQAQGCGLDDVIRLKAFFKPGPGDNEGWKLFAALDSHFPESPAPVISMQPVLMTPWAGQELQLQAIAVSGWRQQDSFRFMTESPPESVALDDAEYTVGLLAGGFFAVSDMPGFRNGFEGDTVAETIFVMDRLQAIMRELDVSFGDTIKKEGYWCPSLAPWEKLAKLRASRFPEGVAVGTVVPWQSPWPSDVTTKVEVLGYRSQLGDRGKPAPRVDSWPDWVWDWVVPVPYRQGLLVDDCIWLGGQIPWGAGHTMNIQSPGDLDRQVDFTLGIIGDILAGFNKRLDDLALLVCYYEADGSEASSRRFIDRLAKNIPCALPPVTLVPQPKMHREGSLTEIWGVARA